MIKNAMMFASMANQSSITMIKDPNNAWKLKKTTDQSRLITSCTPNIKIANLTSLLCHPSRQTRNNATPINKYNVVHTGPNNQFGGDHHGLDNVEYHVEICDNVTIAPKYPITNGINIEPISIGTSLILNPCILQSPLKYIQSILFL